MKTEVAEGILQGAFRTVYPRDEYDEVRADRWSKYRSIQAAFLKRPIESYQEELVKVVFYSGFRSLTATNHMPAILKYLGEPRKVAGYSEGDIAGMLADDGMIKNQRKIRACIRNAKTLLDLDRTHGSVNAYLKSFSDHFPDDKDGILRLLEDLKKTFAFIGPRTGRHFLMNIGFPMVKPDIMIMRVLFRLGLVNGEDGEYIDQAVDVCLEMARLVNIPPAFVDELLVKVGQSEGVEICRKRKPLCEKCGLAEYCTYPVSR